MNVSLVFYLSSFLFCLGIVIVITKRNLIMILVGTELMLNAVNLNLVTFNRQYPGQTDGQMFALFVILIAVCEAAIGLAIILRAYHFYHTSVPDQIADLKEKD